MTAAMDDEVPTRRADAGIPRLTRRDLAALSHLEDMRAMWEPDVAVLLGRLSGRGPVSPTSVRTAIRRWVKLGVCRVQKVFAHEPRLVWLTAQGAAVAGSQGSSQWREPGMGVLRHTAEVARVRGWLEQRGLAGQRVVQWVSERSWRIANHEAVKAGAHPPDGIAITEDGRRFAIEVELNDKGPSRTARIALALTAAFDQVVYVVPEGTQTARAVHEGMLRTIAGDMKSRVGDGRVDPLYLPVPAWRDQR